MLLTGGNHCSLNASVCSITAKSIHITSQTCVILADIILDVEIGHGSHPSSPPPVVSSFRQGMYETEDVHQDVGIFESHRLADELLGREHEFCI
jgi:hypothetical protein